MMEVHMSKKAQFLVLLMSVLSPILGAAADKYTQTNNLPPRLQWDNNSGYCGEVSLINAGLYYGQYLSQYDVRAIICKGAPQDKAELTIGTNDQYAAAQLHLNAVEWNTTAEQNTDDFLAWVKQHTVQGHPVAIGIYMNEYRFYGNTDPKAGDPDYDHIVTVTGVGSNQSLSNPDYFGDDILYFSDHGLWSRDQNPPYHFNYTFDEFQADRIQANAHYGAIYSLSNDASNYGVAITGVMDLNGDTLPVRLDTSINYETPEIQQGSSIRPHPMPVQLTITVSGLEPGLVYNLYRYDTLASVPNSDFNAHASDAYQSWQIKISSGTSYVMTQEIQSDETAVYRAVRATAP
jgi:hypothetical protein